MCRIKGTHFQYFNLHPTIESNYEHLKCQDINDKKKSISTNICVLIEFERKFYKIVMKAIRK
jgi:hypothetical protein